MKNRELHTLLFLCLCTSLFAQNRSYIFSALTKADGLPNCTFKTTLMDKKGFIWFGAEDRLIRWDGRHTKEFVTIQDDSTSLSFTYIKDLLEDIDGTIWVATIGGGVCQFDPKTQRFKRFMYDAHNPHTISDPNVWKLFLDSQNVLWLGTFDGGLSRFNRQTKTFDRFPLVKNLKNIEEAFKRNTVLDIAEDVSNPNIFWLGTNEGIVRFEKSSGTVRLFSPPKTEGQTVFSVVMDAPNELWVGTYGSGIARFDIQTFKWTYFKAHTEGGDKVEGFGQYY